MHPQHRIERAKLEPADEQLAKCRVVRLAEYESADVGGPVGNSRKREIQACRNLPPVAEPIRVDVSGPCRHAVALRPGKRRTRKNKHTLLVRSVTLPLVNSARSHQRKDVDVAVATARRQFVAKLNIFFQAFRLWLGRVHPPGVEPQLKQSLVDQVPIIFPSLRVGRVVSCHPVGVVRRFGKLEFLNKPTLLVHVFILLGARFEKRPH